MIDTAGSPLPPPPPASKRANYLGIVPDALPQPRPRGEDADELGPSGRRLGELVRLVDNGQLRLRTAGTYHLDEIVPTTTSSRPGHETTLLIEQASRRANPQLMISRGYSVSGATRPVERGTTAGPARPIGWTRPDRVSGMNKLDVSAGGGDHRLEVGPVRCHDVVPILGEQHDGSVDDVCVACPAQEHARRATEIRVEGLNVDAVEGLSQARLARSAPPRLTHYPGVGQRGRACELT